MIHRQLGWTCIVVSTSLIFVEDKDKEEEDLSYCHSRIQGHVQLPSSSSFLVRIGQEVVGNLTL